MKLPKAFYMRDDVVRISRELLGKVLCTRIRGVQTSGIITETEAYAGITDKASHAFGGRRTPRTEIMFGEGGQAYVYLCYGIHHLFNVVTNKEDIPHAVLIRAVKPLDGIETMLKRRGKSDLLKPLCGGPGTVSEALGILIPHSGENLLGDRIWIEDRKIPVKASNIKASARIGVGYAQEHALLPWRFKLS